MTIVSRKIRNSARGQECTVNAVGHCDYGTDTTILAHLPDESNGMGKKSTDISSCYCCAACHRLIDRVVFDPDFEDNREWYMRRAMVRTWHRLIDMGIVVIR